MNTVAPCSGVATLPLTLYTLMVNENGMAFNTVVRLVVTELAPAIAAASKSLVST